MPCFGDIFFTMAQISVHQLKSERARSYLRSRLLLLPGGAALPGTRTMMAECGVGRKMLEQAILEAEADGLLVRRSRSAFRRAEPCAGERVDLLIYANNSEGQLRPVGTAGIPGAIPRTILRLQDLAREHGMTSRLYTSFREIPVLPVPLFCLGVTDPETLRKADAEWPRTVTISGRQGKLWVKPPYEDATRAGLEHLADLGHKAVGYLYFRHPDPRMRDRHLFEYYRFMAEHGFKVEPCYTVPYPDDAVVASGIREMFACARPPTAVFAQTVWLPTVYRVLKELKLNIPWQVSVLGLGDTEFVERLHPFPAFVNESSKLMAEKAWELMFGSAVTEGVVTPPLDIFEGASLRRYRG